jgi:hypothetical protein
MGTTPDRHIVVFPHRSLEPTLEPMSTNPPAHSARRRIAAISCLALATLGITAPSSAAGSQPKPPGACILVPAADSMPFEAALLETWRMRDGIAEILHQARCSDGRTNTVWIAANVI